MTYRDQLQFKILKLTRAIDAVADLPTLPHPGHKFLGKLKAERDQLRRAIADGRRSCGECGNPMTTSRSPWVFRCDTPECAIGIVRV